MANIILHQYLIGYSWLDQHGHHCTAATIAAGQSSADAVTRLLRANRHLSAAWLIT